MPIIYNKSSSEFHLYNGNISYIMKILENNQMGHLYFGKRIRHRDSFAHLVQQRSHCHTAYVFEKNLKFSLDTIRQEYPAYGTTDFREPAYQIELKNGSRITDFQYIDHHIYPGKPKLHGLPATYVEHQDEAVTLELILYDKLIRGKIILYYTIFEAVDVVARSACFINEGTEDLYLRRALSMSMDLYDSEYEMLSLDGTWGREKHITNRQLSKGIQAVSSIRGASGPNHNASLVLKRNYTTEHQGEAIGLCLIYSGNFLAQVEVDHYEVARVSVGIHPFQFGRKLEPGEQFQTPEAVLTYTDQGLNRLSQNFHQLFRRHLIRGEWRDKTRPVLLNSWETTYFNYQERSLLELAGKAKELGVELFVLDDGWFGKRNDITSSLGDWVPDQTKLPEGIEGLADKIIKMGLKFGLWFEPEMVNQNSNLYEQHPEWVIAAPGRRKSHGRNQYVLDFTNQEVINHLEDALTKILGSGKVSYLKWDMNRNITEAYGKVLESDRQGEFFHRYILGVYDLYERLIVKFPHILMESCASGGGRFDAGMLYYAPQGWVSDNTDGVERLKCQYGTSLIYPLAAMGNHVSSVPNHQMKRSVSLQFRTDVAYFGVFGYELNPGKLSAAELAQAKERISFYKKYRDVIMSGDFYRLCTPFENNGDTAWMVVSKDQTVAIAAYYKILARPNPKLQKLRLKGLNPEFQYATDKRNETYYGDELMQIGMLLDMEYTGFGTRGATDLIYDSGTDMGDFTSQLFVLHRIN